MRCCQVLWQSILGFAPGWLRLLLLIVRPSFYYDDIIYS